MSLLANEQGTAWWLCPNEPRCPNAAVVHDIGEQDDPLPRCCADGCPCGHKPPPVTHLQPSDGSGVAPCCGKTLFELPGTDRLMADPQAVTCPGAGLPASPAGHGTMPTRLTAPVRSSPPKGYATGRLAREEGFLGSAGASFNRTINKHRTPGCERELRVSIRSAVTG